MPAQKYGIPDEENPEWTAEDWANARPGREVLPPAMVREIEREQQQYGIPDEESPEITMEDLKHARLGRDVLPPAFLKKVEEHRRRAGLDGAPAARRGRPPSTTPRKHIVTLRLDADVLAKYRASGKGWQTRINAILARHAPRRRRARATT